ncbi:Trans-resveratrol di-O-methyltransferase [Vitis vinifera]|uniref:Trans-resveratrol di-O-methyltransferase n=1 Tax=Vitis vinifera TaxID=29760 RepID=A0A438EG73_VITVI|nr:Trans-resveratrol di-O-methyltransferase [Vitis vinifera]
MGGQFGIMVAMNRGLTTSSTRAWPVMLAWSPSVLVKECKGAFEGLNSFVDVGGGTGTVAKTIVEAFPHLHGTVLDLPHVVADLQGSKNLTYLPGDMFEAIPPADAILLKTWRFQNKKGDEDESNVETQLFFDMLMMALLPGREREEKEWKKLFLDSGFSGYKITPILGLRSLIEVYP